MTRNTRFKFTAALVAVACGMALGPALAAPAAAPADAHGHAADAPHKLSLNHGRKWGTDEALRKGMGRIRDLAAPQLKAVHAGKLSPEQYRELSTQIEGEVAGIVANCKLAPEADAMLHLVIADLGAGTEAMAGKTDSMRPQQGYVKVVQAVNAYGKHFDHPGFKAIRTGH